jgi:hypothetical protein
MVKIGFVNQSERNPDSNFLINKNTTDPNKIPSSRSKKQYKKSKIRYPR